MNLIEDQWLPVRRRSGREERIAPWELSDQKDPIIRLASPRPDFDGALVQFLIGLLQTCFAPEDNRQWQQRLRQPPSPDELRNAFSAVKTAFTLDGDGPRFMQDLTLENEVAELPFIKIEKHTCEIEDILIESPGEQTIERNTDHFIKRDQIKALCPACAAIALFTLQINAPSGGSGHRTGIRGGGPLTTLISSCCGKLVFGFRWHHHEAFPLS